MNDREAIAILNAQNGRSTVIEFEKNDRGDFILHIPLQKFDIPDTLREALTHLKVHSAAVISNNKGKFAEVHVTYEGEQQLDLKKLVDAGLKVKGAQEYLAVDQTTAKKEMLAWLVAESNSLDTNPISVKFYENKHFKDASETISLELAFHQESFNKQFADKPHAMDALKQVLRDFGAEGVHDKTPYPYVPNRGDGFSSKRDDITTLSVIAKSGEEVGLDLAKLSEAGVKIPGIEYLKAAFKAPSVTPENPMAVPAHPLKRAVE
jgi:hypothetical protein